MRVIDIDPINDPRWQQLIVEQHSDVFHTPEWMLVLSETYGFNVRAYLLVDKKDRPQAGFPFCKISDDQGERIVSLPFSDYCDPVVQSGEQWAELSGWFLQSGCPVSMRCLHNEIPQEDDRFELRKRAKWHGKDLQDDLGSIWNELRKVEKYTIRKAREKGTVLRIAENAKDLRSFFDLHLKVRKHKYRMLAQPYRFFESIWRNLIEQHKGVLLLAEHEKEVIGGTIFLEWKDTLYYKFNTSSTDNLQYYPNDLLLWGGIEYAKSRGLKRLDLGLSDWDQDGLINFKRKYAEEEKAIAFLQFAPPGGRNGSRSLFHQLLPQLTDILTEETVPDTVTEKAGDLLYRFFT